MCGRSVRFKAEQSIPHDVLDRMPDSLLASEIDQGAAIDSEIDLLAAIELGGDDVPELPPPLGQAVASTRVHVIVSCMLQPWSDIVSIRCLTSWPDDKP